jgi:deoxyribodipyrimidine photo-lyase
MIPLEARSRLISAGEERPGPVVYWMSRDQRARDNWALLFAQSAALRARAPLLAAFCLSPSFPGAALRHYDFLLRGL